MGRILQESQACLTAGLIGYPKKGKKGNMAEYLDSGKERKNYIQQPLKGNPLIKSSKRWNVHFMSTS